MDLLPITRSQQQDADLSKSATYNNAQPILTFVAAAGFLRGPTGTRTMSDCTLHPAWCSDNATTLLRALQHQENETNYPSVSPSAFVESESSVWDNSYLFFGILIAFSIVVGVAIYCYKTKAPASTAATTQGQLDAKKEQRELRRRVLAKIFPQGEKLNSGSLLQKHDLESGFGETTTPHKAVDSTCICPTCKANINGDDRVVTARCKHTFHCKCFFAWCQTNDGADCPVCQQEMWDPAAYRLVEHRILSDDSIRDFGIAFGWMGF